MNQTKVNQIVEYIGTQHEFPFDALDVEEDLSEVLNHFGIHSSLDPDELAEITLHLLKRAIAVEVGEMTRLVEHQLTWPVA